jgi:hypothetical protein
MAKSKVAPKNVATLPRKELAAALAATRLLVHVAEALQMDPKEARCFTDSMTTLQWLRNTLAHGSSGWPIELPSIHELTGPEQWRHVAGPDNPADLPSRGITAAELAGNTFWYHGPSVAAAAGGAVASLLSQVYGGLPRRAERNAAEDPAVALVIAANVEPARRPVEEVELVLRPRVINVTMLVLRIMAPGEDR